MTSVNPLTTAIDDGVPLLVLSPHLDDAVLSCGALMLHALARTEVSVLTLFTEAGPPPYTMSARQYLRQTGARSARELFAERRREDRAVLAKAGVMCVHAGLADALFRRRPGRLGRSPAGWVLPELRHLYPTYRLQISSGRIAAGDCGTLGEAQAVIRRLAGPGTLLLAPMGIGGHVDHVLSRTAAERSDMAAIYYSDFPYNLQQAGDVAGPPEEVLVTTRWTELLEAKAELIRGYRTQVDTLFPGGHIPLVPEVYLFPWKPGADSAGAAG